MMNSDIVLQGELAKDRLLEHFRELQIKQSHFAEKERSENYLLYDERSGLMQIRLGDDRGVATIDSVYLMNNGDQMAKGFGFVFERQDSPGKHTHNWKIPKKTNLDILVETQVAQDFEVLQPLP
ncbi:MAG: hypothetical protein HGA85_09285, partial [Nanoarchaeota archaeon]|nr:hypothetical protein [Nanoarchaeota archaeon]